MLLGGSLIVIIIINYNIAESVTSGLSSNNKKKRILFVDDEPDLTSLFKKALESAGFSVNVFNNSADLKTLNHISTIW
jgi:PleD family two-component response regulator